MKSSHRRHRSSGPAKASHRALKTPNESFNDARSDHFDMVQSWLDATAAPDGLYDSIEYNAQIDDRGRTSSWRPYDLPIPPISPNLHRNEHQRNRHSYEKRAYSISSEPLFEEPCPISQFETSFETGSNKENNKRPHSRSHQRSADGISETGSFGRRPRRKTRPDRYNSKKKAAEGSPKKAVKGKSRRKSRPQKHSLRSSRDVMVNFASGAIPNKRVTASHPTRKLDCMTKYL